MSETHYEVLGVPTDADSATIKKAYRRAARENAPDLNASPESHERMVLINEAARVLLDPGERRKYDDSLKSGRATDGSGSRGSAARSIRVVPGSSDLGDLFPGDTRVIELDVYLTGAEPDDISFDPMSGEGWRVVSADPPDDGSGKYLTVEILVTASDEGDDVDHEAAITMYFDDDAVTADFSWKVTTPVAPPPTAPPTPPPAPPYTRPTPPPAPSYSTPTPSPAYARPTPVYTAPVATPSRARTPATLSTASPPTGFDTFLLTAPIVSWVTVAAPWFIGFLLTQTPFFPRPVEMDDLTAGVDLTQFWGAVYLSGVAIIAGVAALGLLLRSWKSRARFVAAGIVFAIIAVVALPASATQWHSDGIAYATRLWQARDPNQCQPRDDSYNDGVDDDTVNVCAVAVPSGDATKAHVWSVSMLNDTTGEYLQLWEGVELRAQERTGPQVTDFDGPELALLTGGSNDPSKWYVAQAYPTVTRLYQAQPFKLIWKSSTIHKAYRPTTQASSSALTGNFAVLDKTLMLLRENVYGDDVLGVSLSTGKVRWERHCPVQDLGVPDQGSLKQPTYKSATLTCTYTAREGRRDVYSLASDGKMKRISRVSLHQ